MCACARACVCVCVSVATILLKVYHNNILLSRHVSRYITISAYCKTGRVRVVRKEYNLIACSSAKGGETSSLLITSNNKIQNSQIRVTTY